MHTEPHTAEVTMNKKSSLLNRTILKMVTLVFLAGILSSGSSGQWKRSWPAQEKSSKVASDTDVVKPPSPVTDDAPIDPDANVRGKAADSSRSHESSKSHQKTRQNRDR
jgi:hypothetical protein